MPAPRTTGDASDAEPVGLTAAETAGPDGTERFDYELIDIGNGRRLERFGTVTLDRPCPPAERVPRRDPGSWRSIDARYDRASLGGVTHAEWTTMDGRSIDPWTVAEPPLMFECRLAPSGHVGVFPEQAANRAWLIEQAKRIASSGDSGSPVPPAAALNLFAYTGGSTLACAAGGLAVTHVDGARPALAWGRRNADLSGLADRPIRWIADDAAAFARRELRRGRRYAGLVLDPPSYGHGSGRSDWQLERDLPGLLGTCAGLLDDGEPAFILLTAHTAGVDGEMLANWLFHALGGTGNGQVAETPLELQARSGARLALGWAIRWWR